MKNNLKTFFFSAFIFLVLACSSNPYKTINRQYKKQVKVLSKSLIKNPIIDSFNYQKPNYWVGTTNFGLRKPNFVVIHHTAQKSCEQTLKTFTLERTQVSAHYVICEDGTVHHMLNDYLRAWHAGSGKWGNSSDVNSASIGIELDNDGAEQFKDKQMESLLILLENLKKNYAIPRANFIGHADLAPSRKNDPSVFFDWKKLAQKGYGLWYADTTKLTLPSGFNANQAFKIIGYNAKDSTAILTTFKRKFMQINQPQPISESDKKIIYAMMLETLKD